MAEATVDAPSGAAQDTRPDTSLPVHQRPKPRRPRRSWVPYLLLAPGLLWLVVFYIAPMITTATVRVSGDGQSTWSAAAAAMVSHACAISSPPRRCEVRRNSVSSSSVNTSPAVTRSPGEPAMRR